MGNITAKCFAGTYCNLLQKKLSRVSKKTTAHDTEQNYNHQNNEDLSFLLENI